MRRAAKVDSNHGEVVRALRAIGCTVQSLAAIGKGCPDLLVGYRGKTHLMEVKDGTKFPSQYRETPDQVEWHGAWTGGALWVVHSVEAAIGAVTK